MNAMPPRDTLQDQASDRLDPVVLSSEDILQGCRRITIDHEGTEYTLHLTCQNKLLLTK
jgi:hemin uptake protein HemP